MCVRLAISALLIAAAVFILGCSKPSAPQATSPPTTAAANTARTQIADSLKQLLECSTDVRDCFVIIEERHTKKFVQFSGSTNEALLLDLPFAALTPEERIRATTLIVDGHKLVSDEQGFQLPCDRNLELATSASLAVLHDVYRFGNDAELIVTVK